jgi:small conductance mechanosensitive channel
MNFNSLDQLEVLRRLNSSDFVKIAIILILAWVCATGLRLVLRWIAEALPAQMRLPILRIIPIARLSVFIGAITYIVPIIIEPSLQNVIALLASISLVIAFVLKDYASSLVAGLATILENVYQPGDWIEMDGVYGEVTLISLRAVHIVTPYDNEVIIPHYQFWTKKISNATKGSKSLMCVAHFYLHPDHDGLEARKALEDIVLASEYRKPESKIFIAVEEQPWGTHYKIKAYVNESRDQFKFVTDLTLKGKAALRAMKVEFANAVPAIAANSKK